MESLLSRSWFSRIWILQEITIANQDLAQIVCGPDLVLWREMRAAIWLLDYGTRSKNPLWEQPSARQNLMMASRIVEITAKRMLLYLLWVNQTRACQHDKDRVYSVLGIATDGLEVDIRPDYTKKVQELYTEITIRIAHNDSSLMFLSYIESERFPGAPTWVPNVSIPLVSSAIARSHFCVHPSLLCITLFSTPGFWNADSILPGPGENC